MQHRVHIAAGTQFPNLLTEVAIQKGTEYLPPANVSQWPARKRNCFPLDNPKPRALRSYRIAYFRFVLLEIAPLGLNAKEGAFGESRNAGKALLVGKEVGQCWMEFRGSNVVAGRSGQTNSCARGRAPQYAWLSPTLRFPEIAAFSPRGGTMPRGFRSRETHFPRKISPKRAN